MEITASGEWIAAGHEAKNEPVQITVSTVQTEELVDEPSVLLTIVVGEAGSGEKRSVEVYLPATVAENLAELLTNAAIDTRRVPDGDMTNDYTG